MFAVSSWPAPLRLCHTLPRISTEKQKKKKTVGVARVVASQTRERALHDELAAAAALRGPQ